MKNRFRKIVLVCFFLAVSFLLASCGVSKRLIRLGTAGENGIYQDFGLLFADILARDNIVSVEVKETAGSAANLRLLAGGYIQMGLAQANVISAAAESTEMFEDSKAVHDYSAIAGLYDEACQIVVLADSPIEGIRDLGGRTVSIGEAESGTEQNAKEILLAYGLNSDLLTEVNLNYSDAAAALKSKEIDAFFCTAGMGMGVIGEFSRQVPVRLLPVDGVERDSILKAYDYYFSYTVPAGSYTGQNEAVETVGVRSVLLVSDEVPEETVRAVTKCLFDHREELQQALPNDFLITAEKAAEGIPVRLHEGAAAYYEAMGSES